MSEHAAADARQAAYFRSELEAHRQQLLSGPAKRRPLIERGGDMNHERSSSNNIDAELRYVDRLIERLDGRFGPNGVEPLAPDLS